MTKTTEKRTKTRTERRWGLRTDPKEPVFFIAQRGWTLKRMRKVFSMASQAGCIVRVSLTYQVPK